MAPRWCGTRCHTVIPWRPYVPAHGAGADCIPPTPVYMCAATDGIPRRRCRHGMTRRGRRYNDVSAAGARPSLQRHAMTAMRSWHLFVKARIHGDSCGKDGTGAVRRCHGAPTYRRTAPVRISPTPARRHGCRNRRDSTAALPPWNDGAVVGRRCNDVSAAGAQSSSQRHAMTAMRAWHLFVKARIYGDSCGEDGTGAVRRCHDAKEVGASFHGAPMVWHTVPHGHFMAPLRTGARRRCNDVSAQRHNPPPSVMP